MNIQDATNSALRSTILKVRIERSFSTAKCLLLIGYLISTENSTKQNQLQLAIEISKSSNFPHLHLPTQNSCFFIFLLHIAKIQTRASDAPEPLHFHTATCKWRSKSEKLGISTCFREFLQGAKTWYKVRYATKLLFEIKMLLCSATR